MFGAFELQGLLLGRSSLTTTCLSANSRYQPGQVRIQVCSCHLLAVEFLSVAALWEGRRISLIIYVEVAMSACVNLSSHD